MKHYTIKPYTYAQAVKIGVDVKPSSRKDKKIDVIKRGKVVASVGAKGYNDYPTYLQLEQSGSVPKGTAKRRRRLYKIRHAENRKIKNSPGWYADKLLW